jgi:hypothetical protein
MFKPSAFRDGFYGTSFLATLRLYLVGTPIFTVVIFVALRAIGLFPRFSPAQVQISAQLVALAAALLALPAGLAAEGRLEHFLRARFRTKIPIQQPAVKPPQHPVSLRETTPRT